MIRHLPLIILLAFLQFHCHSGASKNENEEDIEKKSLLPVKDLLLEDMQNARNDYTAILQRTRFNGRTDSIFLTIEQFMNWTSDRIPKALDSATFQKVFRETSLKDETTGLFQFIYEDTTFQTDVRKVIVYIQPGADNDHIKRIYIESGKNLQDSIADRKILWEMGHYILVAEQKKVGEAKEEMHTTKVIWDPAYFSKD
jgi:hypothetical protein